MAKSARARAARRKHRKEVTKRHAQQLNQKNKSLEETTQKLEEERKKYEELNMKREEELAKLQKDEREKILKVLQNEEDLDKELEEELNEMNPTSSQKQQLYNMMQKMIPGVNPGMVDQALSQMKGMDALKQQPEMSAFLQNL
jgi:DNA repair exonuclease SbcCD ATPase subunit